MGVIVQKDQDKNADLTQRITADLRNRARMQAKMSDPDLVEDSDYNRRSYGIGTAKSRT